jgi:SAM-dependent methyltransferase
VRDLGKGGRSARLLCSRAASAAGRWLLTVGYRLDAGGGARQAGAGSGSQGVGYAARWRPRSTSEARQLILTCEDESQFEETGHAHAEVLLGLVDAGSTVLDLGCGIGRIALYVVPHCGDFWAVDLSPDMLDMARRRLAGAGSVRYALCAGTCVPDVKDESIDFLYSILVLQHIEREDAFLLMEEVVRMLRPGGRAYLTWPNIEHTLRDFVDYARAGETSNPSRARMYTRSEVEAIVPAAGFSAFEILEELPNIVALCTR